MNAVRAGWVVLTYVPFSPSKEGQNMPYKIEKNYLKGELGSFDIT